MAIKHLGWARGPLPRCLARTGSVRGSAHSSKGRQAGRQAGLAKPIFLLRSSEELVDGATI